jgi:hypothetical protein
MPFVPDDGKSGPSSFKPDDAAQTTFTPDDAPPDRIDLNAAPPQVQVTDQRWAPPGRSPITQGAQDIWWDNQKAGLKEDWRRTKKFFGQTVPDAARSVADTAKDVHNYLTTPGQMQVGEDQLQGTPYADPNSSARQLDAFMQRPPLEMLQAVGHGIAPQTVEAPPPPKDTSPGPITALSMGKDRFFGNTVIPAIKGAQSMAAPFINKAMAPDDRPQSELGPWPKGGSPMYGGAVSPGTTPGGSPAGNLLARRALSVAGGEAVEPNPDLPETLAGVNQLEDKLGVTGAAVAQHALTEIPKLPFYLMGSGAGRAAVAGEREAILGAAKLTTPQVTKAALAKLATKEATIEGAAQGAIQTALTPGMDVVTGPMVGGLLGGLAGHAGAYGQAERQVMEHHGALVPAASWEEFLNEVNGLVDKVGPTNRGPAKMASTAPGLSPRTTKLVVDTTTGRVVNSPLAKVSGKVKPGANFEPTTAVVIQSSPGQMIGREVEVMFPTDHPGVELTYRDTPIRDAKEAQKWLQSVRHISMTGGATADEFWQLGKEQEAPGAGSAGYMAPEQMAQFPQGAHVLAKQKRAAFLSKPKDELVGPGTMGDRPVVLNVNERNKMVVTPIANPPIKDPGTWRLAKGDLVMTPAGEARIVRGFAEDGSVLTGLPGRGGPSARFKNEDLKFVNDQDGLATGAMGPKRAPPIGLPNDSASPLPEHLMQVVDGFQTVTIPRLSSAMGMNPVEAGQAIVHLRDRGILKATGEPGVFEVVHNSKVDGLRFEPWGELPTNPDWEAGRTQWQRPEGPVKYPGVIPPGVDEPVQSGMEVWYGTTPGGKGLKGVLRGPDPKQPGHYLLEVTDDGLVERLEQANALAKLNVNGKVLEGTRSQDNRMVSIPGSALRTVLPVNLAKPQLQKFMAIPGHYGVTTPHPPEFVVASKSSAEAINQAVQLSNSLRNVGGWRGKVNTIQGALLNAFYLTPRPLRSKAMPFYAMANATRDAMLRIAERLKEGTGGYGTQPDQDLLKVIESTHGLEQENALKDWAFKHKEESAEVMDTLRSLLAERKELSQWLADRGLASIDMLELARGAGEEPEYVTAMYATHTLKEKYPEWARNNIPDVWDAAVRELTRGNRNAAQVEQELATILRQTDPVKALAKSDLVDNAAFSKLLARKDIQAKYPAIYKLMGPVPSASLRLGHTVGYQRALRRTLETWDAISESPWWSPGKREDLNLHIPMEPRFGKAAGGWTHESLANFVNQKPEEAAGSLARMLGWVGGKWKSFHTVYGGPTPWVNNVLRNLKGVALSGAFQGPEDVEGFRRAPGLMLAWRKNPSMLGPANIIGEAQAFGAYSAGFAGAEMHDARKRIQDELLRAMTRAAGTANSMEDMVMAAQAFMRKNTENIKDAYDAIDQYFKMATYINLRKRYIAQGMSIHDAAAKTTEVIRASYPDFNLVGPLVEQLRGKFGWAAPFISSKAEDMRINAMAAARVTRSMIPGHPLAEPDLLLRLAALGAATYGASSMMHSLRRSNGMSDQDVEDAKLLMTLKQQSWRPALIPMWDRDEKGRIQFIDLTPIEDMTMVLRGLPSDPWWARAMTNTVTDLAGENTYIGRTIQRGAQGWGLISTPPQEMDKVGYGEGGIINGLQEYAAGGVPQAPLRINDAIQKAVPNPMQPTKEVWTPTQAAVKAMGLPYAGPVGLNSGIGALREVKGQVRELRGEAKKIPRRLEDADRSKFLLDAKQRGLGAAVNRVNQIHLPTNKGTK